MKRFCRSASLLALWPCLLLAGPQDVREESPHAEPIGQLAPDEILLLPQPQAPAPAPPPPPAPDIAVDSPGGVTVRDALPALERFGTLAPQQSGFGAQIWEYHTMADALALLEALSAPLPADSRGVAVRRLLLAAANPPREAQSGWLLARAGQLIKRGHMSDARSLLEAVPVSLRDAALLPVMLFAQLAAGAQEPACKTLTQMKAEATEAEPYQRLRVFCALALKRTEEAELAISLREEQGNPFDAWFVQLIESLRYDGVRMQDWPEAPTGVDLAILFSAGSSRWPENLDEASYLDAAYLPYHQLIGRASRDPAIRAAFLESALAAGDGDAKALAAAYGELAASAAKDATAQRARAYHALASARSSAAAAAALPAALDAFAASPALQSGLLVDPAMALSRSLKPGPSHISLAAPMIALLLQAGKDKDAEVWLTLIDRHRPQSPITYVAFELARLQQQPARERSSAARQLPPFTLPAHATPSELRLLQRFFRLMPSFDYAVPEISAGLVDEAVAQQDTGGVSLNTEELRRQARQGSLAGVWLVAAQRPESFATIDDSSLLALVDALNALGQKAAARRVAQDSLLALLYAAKIGG